MLIAIWVESDAEQLGTQCSWPFLNCKEKCEKKIMELIDLLSANT